MSSLQEDLDDAMQDLLSDAGEAALLVRGPVSSNLQIIPAARREHSLRFQTRDFLIPGAGYALAGVPVLPAPGDTITLSGAVWEVRPFEDELAFNPVQGNDRNPWYRIHVKEIGWKRDRIRFVRKKQRKAAGTARQDTENEFTTAGLLKLIGGSEGFDDVQRTAYLQGLVIVPVTPETLDLDVRDELHVEVGGQCHAMAIGSVRDPGTGGSVLYLECNERV